MSNTPAINIDDFNKFIGRKLKDTSKDTDTYKVTALYNNEGMLIKLLSD